MVFCNKCGANNPPGSGFCYKCGTQLVNPEQWERPKEASAPKPPAQASAPAAQRPAGQPREKSPQRQYTPEQIQQLQRLRLQKIRQQQLLEAQKKQARLRKIKIVSAVMAVVVVAAVVVLVLDPLGLLSQAEDVREPGSLVNGDWISYEATDLQNGARGTLKMTFSNVTEDRCTITYVLSLDGKTDTTSQDLKTENGNWSSAASGATGSSSSGNWTLIGNDIIETAFGNKTAVHYQAIDSLGTMDIWASQDNTIAYKLINTTSTATTILEIEDTSLTYEK